MENNIAEELIRIRTDTFPRFYEQIENKFNEIKDDTKGIFEKINTLDRTVSIMETKMSNIESVDVHFIRQKVDDMLSADIFKGIEGGLSYKKTSTWIISIIGSSLVLSLLSLLIKKG